MLWVSLLVLWCIYIYVQGLVWWVVPGGHGGVCVCVCVVVVVARRRCGGVCGLFVLCCELGQNDDGWMMDGVCVCGCVCVCVCVCVWVG